MNEVKSHGCVLKADAAHLFVIGADGFVIAFDAEADVTLVVAQFVSLWMILQPGELEEET